MNKDILNHFKKIDPVMYELARTVGDIPVSKREDFFLSLCDSIISQQLSVKASDTILARFQTLFPDSLPTPEKTLKLEDERLRSVGLSGMKVTYLKDLSQKILDKIIDLDNLTEHSEEEIIAELIKVKGIGRWTAEMFLMFSLNKPDVFSLGDLGLKNAMKKWYKLGDKPTDEEFLKISSKWSPYRTYACRVLWRSLKNEP